MTMYSCLSAWAWIDIYIYICRCMKYIMYISCLYLHAGTGTWESTTSWHDPEKAHADKWSEPLPKAPSHIPFSTSEVHSLVVVAGQVMRFQWIEGDTDTKGHELMICFLPFLMINDIFFLIKTDVCRSPTIHPLAMEIIGRSTSLQRHIMMFMCVLYSVVVFPIYRLSGCTLGRPCTFEASWHFGPPTWEGSFIHDQSCAATWTVVINVVLPQAQAAAPADGHEVPMGPSTEAPAGHEAGETVDILIIYLISLYVCCRYHLWLVLYHHLHCHRLHCPHLKRQDTTFRIILNPIIYCLTLAGDESWQRHDDSAHDDAPTDAAGGTCYYIYIYIYTCTCFYRMYCIYWFCNACRPKRWWLPWVLMFRPQCVDSSFINRRISCQYVVLSQLHSWTQLVCVLYRPLGWRRTCQLQTQTLSKALIYVLNHLIYDIYIYICIYIYINMYILYMHGAWLEGIDNEIIKIHVILTMRWWQCRARAGLESLDVHDSVAAWVLHVSYQMPLLSEAWHRCGRRKAEPGSTSWTASCQPAESGMSWNPNELQLLFGWGDWQDPPMWLRPGMGRTRSRRPGNRGQGDNLEVGIRSCLPLWAPSTCVQWYLDTCSGDAMALRDEPERGAGHAGGSECRQPWRGWRLGSPEEVDRQKM